jgi:bacterioferritin-associated ferredoxin
MKLLTARAEIENREWLEVDVTVSDSGEIEKNIWRANGCQSLLKAVEVASKRFEKMNLNDISFNDGVEHWDLLINEAIDKLNGAFEFPLKEEELCHCRKILAKKVDEAIVLGAHTPEKVRAWTTASSGCGTCRPDVEKLINFRLKK